MVEARLETQANAVAAELVDIVTRELGQVGG
jgi:hypothetical protein